MTVSIGLVVVAYLLLPALKKALHAKQFDTELVQDQALHLLSVTALSDFFSLKQNHSVVCLLDVFCCLLSSCSSEYTTERGAFLLRLKRY